MSIELLNDNSGRKVRNTEGVQDLNRAHRAVDRSRVFGDLSGAGGLRDSCNCRTSEMWNEYK
jgi:hypothetical protein